MVVHVLDKTPVPEEPFLEIEVDGTEILRMEGMAQRSDRHPTSVHLYAYPSLRRVLLEGPDENLAWSVRTSEGVKMGYPWDQKHFIELLDAIARKQ